MHAPRHSDYADWLNPFLVKDLRQTLHSRVFTGIMLWMHVSTALLLGAQAAMTSLVSSSSINSLLLANAILTLHLVFSFRSVLDTDEDVDARNFELIRLTSMDSARLATQKWLSAAAQFLIIAVSLLPYGAARYFVGSVNVLDDLGIFIWLVCNGLLFAVLGRFVATFEGWGKLFVGACAIAAAIVFDVGSAIAAGSGTFNLAGQITLCVIYGVFIVIGLGFLGLRYEPPSPHFLPDDGPIEWEHVIARHSNSP